MPATAAPATAPPQPLAHRDDVVLRRGGWICGAFEGHYVAAGGAPDAVGGARVHDVVLVGGVVKDAKKVGPPTLVRGAPLFQQRRLTAYVDLGALEGPARGAARIYELRLTDLHLVAFTFEPLLDELASARGVVRGTLWARVDEAPRARSLWGCLIPLVLLLLLLLLLLFTRVCDDVVPAAAWREELSRGIAAARGADAGVAIDDAGAGLGGSGDPNGNGGGGTGGGGNGNGGGNGAGAGDGGGGDGSGAGGGDGNGGGDGSGRGDGSGGGGDGSGGAGDGSGGAGDGSGGAGDGNGDGDKNDDVSVADAEADPERFFARCGTRLTLPSDLLFDTNRDVLRPASLPTLSRVASLLRAHQGKRTLLLEVSGHTDARGVEKHNDALSQRRAARVAGYLAQKAGVPRANIRAVGKGEREPLNDDTSPQALAQNRRVELTVRCAEEPAP